MTFQVNHQLFWKENQPALDMTNLVFLGETSA